MIVVHEKPLHWVEAFGLSALLHVGLTFIVFTSVVDVGTLFDTERPVAEDVQITSLSVDIDTVFSPDIGSGDANGAGANDLAPVEPELIEVPAAVVTETLSPEATAPEVAEAVAVAATTADAQAAAETLDTIQAAVAPVTLSPLRPQNPVAALVAAPTVDVAQPVARTPSTSPAPTALALQPTAPVSTATTQAADVTPFENVAAAAPPPLPAAPTPTDTDPLAEELITRIRDSVAATCLIAVPQQANGGVSLQVYAADEAAVGPYVDEILTGLSPRPPLSTALIDQRQCAALDYIRNTVGYPTGPMALGLDATRIESGTELTGRLSGTGGRNITLLLIDDNGVTQDLGNYLTVGVNTARFAAPLRRAGPARDTRQLLVAIGTATRPASSSRQNGRLAEDYFGALTEEVAERATITIAPFDVR